MTSKTDTSAITLRNCNNLDEAKLEIVHNRLNIKYAPNGTGKSTIAMALEASIGSGDTARLTPFKHRSSNETEKLPHISGAEHFKSIMCFDEKYVEQFVFQKDELLSNSFEVFIRSDAYLKLDQDIDNLLDAIRRQFVGNVGLEELLQHLRRMLEAFKPTKAGFAKNSSGMKALSQGDILTSIPAKLVHYEPFLKSKHTVQWIDWQTRGTVFSEVTSACPFCTSDTTPVRERIEQVGKTYDKQLIKHLVDFLKLVDDLGSYLTTDTQKKLVDITALPSGTIGLEQETFLLEVYNQVKTLEDKLIGLKGLAGFKLYELNDVVEALSEYKIDLSYFSHLGSERMANAIDPLNDAIDSLIDTAGELRGKVAQQRVEVRRRIERYQTEINSFLTSGGYQYLAIIDGEGPNARLKLRHKDYDAFISHGTQHLSYGEKNAFALVLFMYECIAKAPDLVILDDPISSFDNNKKFAILNKLFRQGKGKCLQGETVLLLTHDLQPVIDTERSLARLFAGQTASSFLRLSRGTLDETPVRREDIQSFADICIDITTSNCLDIIKAIYLRRYLELISDRSDAYEVLANAIKGRQVALDHRKPRGKDGAYPAMEPNAFKRGLNVILGYMASFDYSEIVRCASDPQELLGAYQQTTVGYEKLQLFRMLGVDHNEPIVQKFINETYHIENEYLFQLDPRKYDTIPAYIVQFCDRLVEGAFQAPSQPTVA